MNIVYPHIRHVVYRPESQQVAPLLVRMCGNPEFPPVPSYTVISREGFLNNSRYSRGLGSRHSARVPSLRATDIFGIRREQPFSIQGDYRGCRTCDLQPWPSFVSRACLSERGRSPLWACGRRTVFSVRKEILR